MGRMVLGAFLLGLGLLACAHRGLEGHGPLTLEAAAASAPEGPRRASLYELLKASEALEHGELESARAMASRALRIDGQNPYAYFVLAQVAVEARDPETALRHLDQAEVLFVAVEPRNTRWPARVVDLKAQLVDEDP